MESLDKALEVVSERSEEELRSLPDNDPALYDSELYRPVTQEEVADREFKDAEKQMAIQAFAAGLTLEQTAQLLSTTAEHLKEQLGKRMDAAKQRQIMRMAQLALREAQCDSSMLRWWLGLHGGDNFKPQPAVAVSNQMNVQVNVRGKQ